MCHKDASIGGARRSVFSHLKNDAVWTCKTVLIVGVKRCIENKNGDMFWGFLGNGFLIMTQDLGDFALEDGKGEGSRCVGKEGKV